MSGQTQGEATAERRSSLGKLDADTVDRIDVHLERAMDSEGGEKDFHVRHARQLLEGCRDC
jgi:hypothetical protein